MTKWILIISLLLLCSCDMHQNKNNVNYKSNFDCNNLRQKIKETRLLIDSFLSSNKYFIDVKNADKVDSLNSNLINYLNELAIDDRFQTCNVNLGYEFYSILSSDKRFCITSWNTNRGGTMIDFTNVVIYKTTKKTFVKQLLYGDSDDKDNSKIMFDTLFTIHNNKGQAIYIAYGFGQESYAMPFKVIKAFMITDSLIENINIFPKEINSLEFNDPNCQGVFLIEYDLQKFKNNDQIQEIKFANGGLEIKIPIIKENGRPSKKYYSLFFDGEKYVRKRQQ